MKDSNHQQSTTTFHHSSIFSNIIYHLLFFFKLVVAKIIIGWHREKIVNHFRKISSSPLQCDDNRNIQKCFPCNLNDREKPTHTDKMKDIEIELFHGNGFKRRACTDFYELLLHWTKYIFHSTSSRFLSLSFSEIIII